MSFPGRHALRLDHVGQRSQRTRSSGRRDARRLAADLSRRIDGCGAHQESPEEGGAPSPSAGETQKGRGAGKGSCRAQKTKDFVHIE